MPRHLPRVIVVLPAPSFELLAAGCSMRFTSVGGFTVFRNIVRPNSAGWSVLSELIEPQHLDGPVPGPEVDVRPLVLWVRHVVVVHVRVDYQRDQRHHLVVR